MVEDVDLLEGQALRRVVVESPAGAHPDFRPFGGLLRPAPGGGVQLTGTAGHWLPELEPGERLLLVEEGDEGEFAAAVRIASAIGGGSDTVLVTPDGEGRRMGRREPRTVVEGTAVTVNDGGADLPGVLIDVSLTGLHVEFEDTTAVPKSGVEVSVSGVTAGVGTNAPWQLWGTVAWSRQFYRAGSCGILLADGQRRAITRLVRWARVQELRAEEGAPPLP